MGNAEIQTQEVQLQIHFKLCSLKIHQISLGIPEAPGKSWHK